MDTGAAWPALCASPTSQRSQPTLSCNEPTENKAQLLEKEFLWDIFRELDWTSPEAKNTVSQNRKQTPVNALLSTFMVLSILSSCVAEN